MSRRFKKLNVPHQLIIANNGITHGFLNMTNLTNETQDAYEEIIQIISNAFNDQRNKFSLTKLHEKNSFMRMNFESKKV